MGDIQKFDVGKKVVGGSYIIYSQRDRVPFSARSNRRGSLDTTAVGKLTRRLWETANGASSSLLRGWRASGGHPPISGRVPPVRSRVRAAATIDAAMSGPPRATGASTRSAALRARLVPRSRRACQRRTAMPINATGLAPFYPSRMFRRFLSFSLYLSIHSFICLPIYLYFFFSLSLSFSFSLALKINS